MQAARLLTVTVRWKGYVSVSKGVIRDYQVTYYQMSCRKVSHSLAATSLPPFDTDVSGRRRGAEGCVCSLFMSVVHG